MRHGTSRLQTDDLGRVTGIDAGAGVVRFAYRYEPNTNNIDTKVFQHRNPVVAIDRITSESRTI